MGAVLLQQQTPNPTALLLAAVEQRQPLLDTVEQQQPLLDAAEQRPPCALSTDPSTTGATDTFMSHLPLLQKEEHALMQSVTAHALAVTQRNSEPKAKTAFCFPLKKRTSVPGLC